VKRRPDLLRGVRGPRPPQQRRSVERRDAIVEAAIHRFGREGYARASIQMIAREAGVSTGAVYQFFRSKDHVLLVAMDALLVRIEAVPPPLFPRIGDRTAEMEAFLADVFRRERPFVGVYRAWQEAALVAPEIAEHDRRIRAWSSARILGLFTRLAALSGARSDVDLPELARLWDGIFWNLLAHPPSTRSRAVRTVARVLHGALFADGGALVSSTPSAYKRPV
jgi:AcrR family transcriptional regulator